MPRSAKRGYISRRSTSILVTMNCGVLLNSAPAWQLLISTWELLYWNRADSVEPSLYSSKLASLILYRQLSRACWLTVIILEETTPRLLSSFDSHMSSASLSSFGGKL